MLRLPNLGTGDLLVGRSAELDQLRAVLGASRSDAFPGVIRISGGSGIGKSALLRALLCEASASGWLTVSVVCHPAHRQRPLTTVTQILHSLLRSLGDQAPRYTSGLERALATIDPAVAPSNDHKSPPFELTPAQLEALFLRLLHGVLTDHPTIFALDDSSWVDGESIRVIDFVLASSGGYPFVVATAGRPDESAAFSASLPTWSVSLRPLAESDAEKVLRTIFPSARHDVASAIIAYARGIPLDLVTLSASAAIENIETAEAVLDSVRAVVVSDVRKMAPDLRWLLQLCSIIPEPIPLRLLIDASGRSEKEVLDVLARDGDRYLIRTGVMLRFRHALISDAVRCTVEDQFVFERRALGALLNWDAPSLDDCQRIAELAAECGEREIRYQYLVRLADAAYRSLQFQSAVSNYRLASAVRPPHPDEYVEFYRKLTIALRANDYDADAAAILRMALRDAQHLGVSHRLGELAGALVLTLCSLDDFDQAARIYEYYFDRLEDPEDRSEVVASAACMFADTMETKRLEDAVGRAAELPRKTNYANAKLEYARATAESRLGNHEAACRALKAAAFHSELDQSLMSYNMPFDQLVIDFRHYGNAVFREQLPEIASHVCAETGTHAFAMYFATFSDFLCGAFESALARLSEMNLARFAPAIRAKLFSVPAAIQAFSARPSPYTAQLRSDMELLVRGVHERSAVLLGSWWIAIDADIDRREAESLATTLRRWSKIPPAIHSISFMPVSLSLYAERIGDRALLREIAVCENAYDTSPWMVANTLLARGVALDALGERIGRKTLRDSSERFARLGAPFLAAYAAARARSQTPENERLLNSVGVNISGGPTSVARDSGRRLGPTVRELEIARLVARGKSNRTIAQELFLSERTVEVHIANLFGKLGIGSRTQLVRWILENDSVCA